MSLSTFAAAGSVDDSAAALDAHAYAQSIPDSFIHAFVAEQVIGAVLIVAVIITVLLSHTLHRTVTWLNLLVCWVISALSYILLSFVGKQTGPQPSFSLCVFQATLTYGAPVLCAFAALSLTIQVWFDMTPSPKHFWSTNKNIILLCIPYIVYLCVMIEAMTVALHSRESVVRGAYCVVRNKIPGRVTAALVIFAAGIGIIFQIFIGQRIYWIRRNIDAYGIQKSQGISLGMLIRMSLASLSILSTIVISVVMTQIDAFSQVPNGTIGAMPFIVFVLFGLNKDVIRVWCFWKQKSPVLVTNIPAAKLPPEPLV